MAAPLITGMGIITPFGDNNADLVSCCEKITDEKSPFSSENSHNIEFLTIKSFDIKKYISTVKLYLDKNSAFLLAACKLAIENAGISEKDLEDAALCTGTAYGGTETIERFYADVKKKGIRFAKPILFPHTYLNTAISLCSIEFGIKGVHINFCSGDNASSQALLYAADIIQKGYTDIAVVGGCDTLSPMLCQYFLHSIEQSVSEKICFAESAGVIIMENKQRAEKRKASIYAQFDEKKLISPNNESPRSSCMSEIMGNINFMGTSGIIRTIISCL